MEQPAGLISVLLDPVASIDERDDAAMDLADYDEPEALAALLRVGSNDDEPDMVLASAGESIAEILLRTGRVTSAEVESLTSIARREFDARINSA